MERNETPTVLPHHVLSFHERLKRLQEALDGGLITRTEYEAQRQKAVEEYARGDP